jgi:hypothetical protein
MTPMKALVVPGGPVMASKGARAVISSDPAFRESGGMVAIHCNGCLITRILRRVPAILLKSVTQDNILISLDDARLLCAVPDGDGYLPVSVRMSDELLEVPTPRAGF